MAAGPPDEDPIDQDPRERGLERRAGGASGAPWVIVALIAMLAALAYVLFSMG